jgi:PPOX class probable F420-dependent enzyme
MQRSAPPTGPAGIPASHRDLLEQPLVAVLTTLLPDGRPQTQPVWFSFEEPYVLINTMRGFRKELNMRADPRVTLLVVDPAMRERWIEMQGVVELVDEGARSHLDSLARLYVGVERYFGDVVAIENAAREIPVLGRITPLWVVTAPGGLGEDVCTSMALAHAVRPASSQLPPVAVPDSHRDLLVAPLGAVLTTLMPDGHPQTQPVGFDFDGTDVLINTTRERQAGRNLQADPRATFLLIDPADSSRWIEIRGDVDISEEGALERLDALETRIICRLHPRRIVCDAIHR